MRSTLAFTLFLVCLAGYGGPSSNEPLTVSKLFRTGAVLQRNTTVPVWGTAASSTTVTVSLDYAEQSVRAAGDGTWMVELEPRPAGGPHQLMVTTNTDTLIAENIMFGDVWIASGQSNMEWTVANSADAENEIASADDTLLRHYKVPRTWSYDPEDTLAGGEWHHSNPEHVAAFTAVGYSFARELRAAADIPIGILNTSWGGSRVEAWMDPTALELDETQIAQLLDAPRARADSLMQVYTEEHGASADTDPGFDGDEPIWADPELDASDWMEIAVPGTWEAGGLEGLNGIAWYRTTFELESVPAEAELRLGTVDDRDMTWINGQLVGETGRYLVERAYTIPEGVLIAGTNQLTVRVHDTGGNGGIVVGDYPLALQWSGGEVQLEGMWKIRVGQFQINPGGSPNQQPTLLYNAMIHPIISYPVTGFIWYQGESNATDPETATAYAGQFQSMILRWRELWDNAAAPFLFVSLASFLPAQEEPGESNWAILRESQAAALELPKVGQAITLDVGEADDIHPRNKQDVGYRLALWARNLVYGDELVYSGPIYRDHLIEDGKIYITFDHTGGGLVSRDGPLGGFAISGPDEVYVWAEAQIQGDSVVVSHPDIPNPVAVRYAWADNPDTANLINVEGLPAAPFRTGR